MVDLQSAVFGDDLALLSLKVAAQVDRKLSGIQIDHTPFVDFRNELSKTTGVENTEQATGTICYLQSNPAATEILAKALHETCHQPISNTAELATALTDIIETIKRFDESEPSHDDLSKMKLFCLSLHRSMMSQRLPPLFDADHAFEDRLGILR